MFEIQLSVDQFVTYFRHLLSFCLSFAYMPSSIRCQGSKLRCFSNGIEFELDLKLLIQLKLAVFLINLFQSFSGLVLF